MKFGNYIIPVAAEKNGHNSKEDPGFILLWSLNEILPLSAFPLSKLLPLENDGSPSQHHPTMSHESSKSQHVH